MKKSNLLKAFILSMTIIGLSACNLAPRGSNSGSSTSQSEEEQDERYQIYLLAKEAGYQGTYEEWLASIKGADGSSLLNGTTNPSNSLGNDGDTYINTSTWDVFVKNGGAWTKVGNIMGKQGEPGKDGKSAYELYCEAHPEYEGDEDQWLDDLINGRLGNKEVHTVTFSTDGGSEVETQYVYHGEKATKPVDPTKDGYIFNGWSYKDEIWSFVGYIVTEDMTLNAIWEEEQIYHTVTFNTDGGSYIEPQQVLHNGKIIKPDDPTKDGYSFDYWEFEGEQWSFVNSVVTEDMTLKAIWTDGPEKLAVQSAKNLNIVTVDRSIPLIVDTPTDIGQTNGLFNNDYLFLVTEVRIYNRELQKEFTVEIDWDYDDTDPFLKEVIQSDDSHISLYFNYSKTEEHDFSLSASFKCGAYIDETPSNYQVHLLLKNLDFLELSIPEIYEINETNDGFKLVDPETGTYVPNNDNYSYLCFETTGEVLYISPDGNWALIGDGDYVLELYSGAALNLNSSYYPSLVVGNTITVQGELTSYYGNCQVSFIFSITEGDSTKITKPTGYTNLAGEDFENKHYWENGLMNSIRAVDAIYDGNLKARGSTPITPDNLVNRRFTFDVLVDGIKIQVSYDYHVDRDGDLGIYDSYKQVLMGLSIGSSISLKGTLRFSGSVQKTYKGNEESTVWTITPFLADHIVAN